MNGVVGNWMFVPLAGSAPALGSYTRTFTYSIPTDLPAGIYTVYIGALNANGQGYPGNYTRFEFNARSAVEECVNAMLA